MKSALLVGLGLTLLLGSATSFAQEGEPSYEADPNTYKLIFEDENFRVIVATWKAGTADKPHTHPVPSVVYALNDCTIKIHNADGTERDVDSKSGTAMTVPIVTHPHRAENANASDCHAVIVERK